MTPNAEISISHYDSNKKLLFYLKMDPLTVEKVKIPVSTNNGSIIIPETNNMVNCVNKSSLTKSTISKNQLKKLPFMTQY